MDKTSSVITGSATAAAAAIAPLIDWIANGRFKWDMPSPVVLIISAAAVTAGHFMANFINALPPVQGSPFAPTRITKEGGFARFAVMPLMAIVAAGAIALAGCATTTGAQNLTPEQVAAQVCPAAQF